MIESFWYEFMRFLPLSSIIMACVKVYYKCISFTHIDIPNFGILRQAKPCCCSCWSLESKDFHYNPIQIFHIVNKLRSNINFTSSFEIMSFIMWLISKSMKFISNFTQSIRCLCTMSKERLNSILSRHDTSSKQAEQIIYNLIVRENVLVFKEKR